MNLSVQFASTPTSECIHPHFYKDRLLVSGIPPGVDKEIFGLFLQNFTSIDEEKCQIQESLDGSITLVFKEEQSETSKCLKIILFAAILCQNDLEITADTALLAK